MGEKILGRYEFGFEQPDKGLHLVEVKKVDVTKDAEKGWMYKIEATVLGGESDGRKLFENFTTRSPGHIGLQRLTGCLIKMGVLKEQEYDSDMFETPQFENSFRSKTVGKKYGVEIEHNQSKKPGSTTIFANVKAYFTVKELKAKLGGDESEVATPIAFAKPKTVMAGNAEPEVETPWK